MSAGDTARPEQSGRVFPARPSVPGQNQHELIIQGEVAFAALCSKSLFVHLRSPNMTKRDPVVADVAPSADTLNPLRQRAPGHIFAASRCQHRGCRLDRGGADRPGHAKPNGREPFGESHLERANG